MLVGYDAWRFPATQSATASICRSDHLQRTATNTAAHDPHPTMLGSVAWRALRPRTRAAVTIVILAGHHPRQNLDPLQVAIADRHQCHLQSPGRRSDPGRVTLYFNELGYSNFVAAAIVQITGVIELGNGRSHNQILLTLFQRKQIYPATLLDQGHDEPANERNSAAGGLSFLEASTRAVPAHPAVMRTPAAKRQPQRKWGDCDFIYPQYPGWNIPSY